VLIFSVWQQKIDYISFTPLIASPVLQLVSEPVKNFSSLIGLKSTKETWNVVLASHRSSMGATIHTGRFEMSVFLQSLRYQVLEICLDVAFNAARERITPIQVEFHDSNNKARNTLFSCLSWVSLSELDI
jgi:hypothetical protein